MAEHAQQLAFDLEALGLELNPTPAMLAGHQRIVQHSWCGAVLVWSYPDRPDRPARGANPRNCPICDHPNDPWWEQEIGPSGLAGLRPITPTHD